MVVGIQTLIDARFLVKSKGTTSSRNEADISKALFGMSTGVIVPSSSLCAISLQRKRKRTQTSELEFAVAGEQVYALQYREIKYRWLSRRSPEAMKLSKTRRWSCLEGKKRELYADSSDEEDEDTIAMEFDDESELAGEWMTEDFDEGILYTPYVSA